MHLTLRDLAWFAPFTSLGLIILTPLRPAPVFPVPAQHRIVTDGQGVDVAIPLPIRIVASDGSVDYLELTHAPEAIVKAGGKRQQSAFSRGLWGRMYPQLAHNDGLWTISGDVETSLAEDDGATYFEWDSTRSRRLGLAGVTIAPKSMAEFFQTLLRVENAALGTEARGKALYADYQQAYADLKQELQPETLTTIPRVLPMGSSSGNWSNIWVADVYDMFSDERSLGVSNASIGFDDTGRQQEAERILAMNPDIIFAGGVDDLLHDPRWQGLKAVQNKRVYSGFGVDSGVPSWRFDSRPLVARWVAEVTHPERLQPKMRALARDHFLKSYGYRLSDDELDEMLGVREQKTSPGYQRFFRDYHPDPSSTQIGGTPAQ